MFQKVPVMLEESRGTHCDHVVLDGQVAKHMREDFLFINPPSAALPTLQSGDQWIPQTRSNILKRYLTIWTVIIFRNHLWKVTWPRFNLGIISACGLHHYGATDKPN